MNNTINFEQLQETYKKRVNNIKTNVTKKFFCYPQNIKSNISNARITSYDDMFMEMYFKPKYFNRDIYTKLNLEYPNSGNLIKDVNYVLSKIDVNLLHDNKFKTVKLINNRTFYFTPKDDKEIIMYNSISRNTFRQSDFSTQIKHVSHILDTYYEKIYNKTFDITFYEEDENKYNIIWIILKINDKEILKGEDFGFDNIKY